MSYEHIMDFLECSSMESTLKFLFQVVCNGIEYQPSVASNNKKAAKAMAATAALQTMGLVPKT